MSNDLIRGPKPKQLKEQECSVPTKTTNKREITRVTKGIVKKHPKSLSRKIAAIFLEDENRTVGSYIIEDVLIPAGKDMFFELIRSGADSIKYGFERMLFNDDRRFIRRNDRRGGYTPYASFYRDDTRRSNRSNNSNRSMSQRSRAQHDFDEIEIETRGEAEHVIRELNQLILDYRTASVEDLYQLVGVESTYIDRRFGWNEPLVKVRPIRTRGGRYLLNLPAPINID